MFLLDQMADPGAPKS